MPTKIEWATESWNPIRARDLGPAGTGPGMSGGWHCEIVTPGCENCYAQAINRRLGTHRPYLKTSRKNVHLYLDEKILTQPLRWRRPRRIFVCSMSDLYGEWVPTEMITRVWAIMALCKWHTFIVLTKRTRRQRDCLARLPTTEDPEYPAEKIWEAALRTTCPDSRGEPIAGIYPPSKLKTRVPAWPLPNVWVGGSVEDQRRADERIPALLETPAAVRWISAEPLLEFVDFHDWFTRDWHPAMPPETTSRIDWAVVGGESGPGARPFNIEWARSIIAQCKDAGVPVFIKQVGAWPIDVMPFGVRGKGGDPEDWPQDLRVREYPDEFAREGDGAKSGGCRAAHAGAPEVVAPLDGRGCHRGGDPGQLF